MRCMELLRSDGLDVVAEVVSTRGDVATWTHQKGSSRFFLNALTVLHTADRGWPAQPATSPVRDGLGAADSLRPIRTEQKARDGMKYIYICYPPPPATYPF